MTNGSGADQRIPTSTQELGRRLVLCKLSSKTTKSQTRTALLPVTWLRLLLALSLRESQRQTLPLAVLPKLLRGGGHGQRPGVYEVSGLALLQPSLMFWNMGNHQACSDPLFTNASPESKNWGKRVSSGGSMSKGPEVGMSLVHLRNRVAGLWWQGKE